jgi:hypothetical protein
VIVPCGGLRAAPRLAAGDSRVESVRALARESDGGAAAAASLAATQPPDRFPAGIPLVLLAVGALGGLVALGVAWQQGALARWGRALGYRARPAEDLPTPDDAQAPTPPRTEAESENVAPHGTTGAADDEGERAGEPELESEQPRGLPAPPRLSLVRVRERGD